MAHPAHPCDAGLYDAQARRLPPGHAVAAQWLIEAVRQSKVAAGAVAKWSRHQKLFRFNQTSAASQENPSSSSICLHATQQAVERLHRPTMRSDFSANARVPRIGGRVSAGNFHPKMTRDQIQEEAFSPIRVRR